MLVPKIPMFNEQINKKDIWNPCFYKAFGGFESLSPLWQHFQFQLDKNWPSLNTYNDMAQSWYELTSIEKPYRIRFVEQRSKMQYEMQIHQQAQVPTRLFHWHDFFNNMTWLAFPRIKWALNRKTIAASDFTHQQRTPIQNVVAHFDECGMVLCSDKNSLFELVKGFAWKSFFWEAKDLLSHCFPIILGHGLLEKALVPYIGMTAKAILLEVNPDFFSLSMFDKLTFVDRALEQYILSEDFPTSPQALHPFPILGWPYWHENNRVEAFYENKDYFRITRNKLAHTIESAFYNSA